MKQNTQRLEREQKQFMGVCIALLHISKDKWKLTKYMEVNPRRDVLEKAFLMLCNLTSTKELGKLDGKERTEDSSGKMGCKDSAPVLALVLPQRSYTFFFFFPVLALCALCSP